MNIGIDVGGTNLRAGVADGNGHLRSRVSVPVGRVESPEALIRRLAELARQAVQAAYVTEGEIQSVGVGIPGAVAEGKILYTCNLPLQDVPFEKLFRGHFDRPVYLENDANCAAIGEWLYGAGRGLTNFVMITLGTGLGGGFILNGKPYGGRGMAGEIGHMAIRRDGWPCSCGRRGCWEAYCSATGLIRRIRAAMDAHPESLLHRLAEEIGTVEGRTAFQAAEQGDPAALEVCRAYGEDLAAGLTDLVNALDPEAVALGGGVAGAPEALLLKPVRELVAQACYARHVGKAPRIVTAELGGDAGLIGAASLGNVI